MNSVLRMIYRMICRMVAALGWMVTFIAVLLLGFGYLLPQDLTRTNEPYASLVAVSFYVRVLTFQVGLVLVLIGFCGLLIRRRWLLLIAGTSGLLAMLPTIINCMPHDPPRSAGPRLRIMSMNLKYSRRQPEEFLLQIKAFDPDVIVLEDYVTPAKAAIDRSFLNDYPHRYAGYSYLRGLAIYSRLPFDGGHPQAMMKNGYRQVRAVIDFNGHPLALYVEHPYSPRSKAKIIENRLQTADLAKDLLAEKLPAIVAGDFNFTETTPNEAALKAVGLKDGFELAGSGRGSTWPVDPMWMQWLPGVRIDHIFVSQQLTCTHFAVGEYDGSDHLPIVADIAAAPAH